MAMHDLFRARETCDRVVILHGGVLVSEVDPRSVSANDLEEIYLEHLGAKA